MAYKKYIERNGKIYGPYIYESKRVDGKVVSQYHGAKKSPFSQPIKITPKKFLIYVVPILVLALLILFITSKASLTGHAVMELNGNYIQGQPFSGTLNLALQQGEFIPADTKLVIKNNDNIQEYQILELTDVQLNLGNFYLEEKSISGKGEGYGIMGTKTGTPEVYFKLTSTIQAQEVTEPINQETETTETEAETSVETETPVENNSETETNETIPEETIETETPVETTTEPETIETPTESEQEITPEETSEQPIEPETPVETPSEPETTETTPEPQVSPITGNVVRNVLGSIGKFFMSLGPTGRVVDSTQEIQGDVQYNKEYVYNLKQGESISLTPNSVKTATEDLDDSQIQISQENNKATITTNYYLEEQGFGKEYINSQKINIPLDLSNLNLQFEKGNLEISLVYEGKEISSIKTKLNEDRSLNLKQTGIEEMDITIPEEASLPPELQLQILTDEEKFILLNTFGTTQITQTAKDYKDRIIVAFSLDEFQVEYSYQKDLPKQVLDYYIERDKRNWLKDIAYNLEEKRATSTPITNLTKETNLF